MSKNHPVRVRTQLSALCAILIAMMMAAVRPTAMGVVVLNDIGPVIETTGLARIMGYVGRTRVPRSWEDAAHLLREMNERAFPAIESWQWEEIARAVFNEGRNGKPAPTPTPTADAPVTRTALCVEPRNGHLHVFGADGRTDGCFQAAGNAVGLDQHHRQAEGFRPAPER